MIDTFSANSLKILDKSLDEFIDIYIFHLSIYKKDERADIGSKYHALICQYLRGHNISKMKLELKNPEIFDKFIKQLSLIILLKPNIRFLLKMN